MHFAAASALPDGPSNQRATVATEVVAGLAKKCYAKDRADNDDPWCNEKPLYVVSKCYIQKVQKA